MKNTHPFLSNETDYKKTRLPNFSQGLLFVLLLFFVSKAQAQGDDCSNALALTNVTNFCSSTSQYTSAGSTASTFSAAPCWTASATSDVWFSFVAIGTNVLISVNGATIQQPRIAIYSGSCAGPLNQVIGGCTNGTGGSPDSQLFNTGLVQGTTYLIRISSTAAQRGSFQLCINNYTPPPVASADCGGAGRLCNKNSISVTGLTSGGINTNENAGTCLSGFGIFETNSVWYTWTCQTAGTLTMDIIPANQMDDIDFIIFQLNTANPCGPRTAIRCTATSFINANASTGLNASSTDQNETVGWTGIEDAYVQQINMTVGTSYAILINNTNATNGFSLNWGGTGTFVGPDANITGGPFTVCAGTPISFDGSTSTNYTALDWNFVNGSGSPANPTGPGPHTVSYPAPGNYVAILNATSSTGCASVETVNVIVNPFVTLAFAAVPDICSGQAAPAFPAQTNVPTIFGTWSPAAISNTVTGTYTFTPNANQCALPGSISVNVLAMVTPTFPAHPTYCLNAVPQALPTTSDNGVTGTWSPATISTSTAGTVNYTFTPNSGQCTSPVTVAIVVGPAPIPQFTQIPALCSGDLAPVLLTTSNDAITGTWSPAIVNNTTSGTYTFTPDAGQCASIASMTITVNNPIVPNLTPAGPFCENAVAAVNLTADIAGGTWSGNGITDPSGVFTPGIAGAGTHTVTYVHTQGCGGTNTMNIVVDPAPNSNFTADALSGCIPLHVHFTSDPAVAISAWDFGDSSTGNGVGGVDHTFNTAGTYSITLTNTANGCSTSTTQTNYIMVYPNPDAIFNASPQVLSQTETDAQFNNHSVNGSTYFWTFGDGENSNAENPSHHYPAVPGNYTITLTVTSTDGCVDVASSIITIKDDRIIYVPNTFTPDGDEFNNVFAPIVTAGYDTQNYSFTIYNRWGETLFESHDVTKGWDGTYMGKLVQAGIYTWTIRIKNLDDDRYEVFKGHVNMMR